MQRSWVQTPDTTKKRSWVQTPDTTKKIIINRNKKIIDDYVIFIEKCLKIVFIEKCLKNSIYRNNN